MNMLQQTTRRTFLKTSAAASAALLTARSYAQSEGANSRLRMAFIGCGGMASHHLEKLLDMRDAENIEIVAVCDVYEKEADRFRRIVGQKGGGNIPAYTDYRNVLDMADLDYVLIATPEHSHAYITLDALDAGKHVYVEKPMTHTIEEAQAVVKKANETGLKLQVGVQGMADDSYASAYESIKGGKLGSVVEAQIDYVRNYTDLGPFREKIDRKSPKPDDLDWQAWLKPAPEVPWSPEHYHEWRCYAAYSGGIATDLFIHRLTRILKSCGLGAPSQVVGMGGIYTWPDGRDLPDSFEMLIEYPAMEGITNGMTVHTLGTMANDDGVDHCIRGTEATLYFTSKGWEIKEDKSGEVLATHEKTGSEDVAPHHANHHAAIREGAALNCPPELGLYGVIPCVLANESWRQKKMMAWEG